MFGDLHITVLCVIQLDCRPQCFVCVGQEQNMTKMQHRQASPPAQRQGEAAGAGAGLHPSEPCLDTAQGTGHVGCGGCWVQSRAVRQRTVC